MTVWKDLGAPMRNNTRYINAIRANGDVPTSEIIRSLIDGNKSTAAWQKELYERYKASASGVPIFSRELTQNQNAGKINNKLNNDYPGEIVDTKVGYFIGIPISYVVKDEGTPDEIENFNRNNDVADMDAETVKTAAITGMAARLLYINPDGEEAVKKVDPWECVFVYTENLISPEYSMRHYVSYDEQDEETTYVEWYTPNFVAFFKAQGESGFVEYEKRRMHTFGYTPLFGIPNNEELQGDFVKVISLVDAFDRALSDQSSEIEQLRLAYMVVRGMVVGETPEETQQFLEQLQKTGMIEIDGDGEVNFITKNINADFVEKHLDRLEKRIMQGAKTVNFADEAFGGNLSGVALKYKLFNLETKCMYLQNKFTKALRQQYKMLANSWSKRPLYKKIADIITGKGSKGFNSNALDFKFTRNVFIDYKNEAEILGLLTGNVSRETALSLMSFIPNPRAEMDKMEEEKEAQADAIDLDDPSLKGEEEDLEKDPEEDGEGVKGKAE